MAKFEGIAALWKVRTVSALDCLSAPLLARARVAYTSQPTSRRAGVSSVYLRSPATALSQRSREAHSRKRTRARSTECHEARVRPLPQGS